MESLNDQLSQSKKLLEYSKVVHKIARLNKEL